MASISVAHHTDPGCPWAYSASPAHAVLQWRYGAQLDWRLVLIVLADTPKRYERAGYSPARQAQGYLRFERRFGMPFGRTPRERVVATERACRAVVATRLLAPGREHAVFRALQFAQFTTTLLFDTDDGIAAALRSVAGIDPGAILAALDDPGTTEALVADRAEARTAAGSPTEAQGRAATTDGPVRYTAPSLVFTGPDGRTLEAGGFQHLDAYDVLVANLDPTLERRAPAEDPVEAVSAFPDGLTTAEVAAITTPHLGETDLEATERALVQAAATGAVQAETLGTSTVWCPPA